MKALESTAISPATRRAAPTPRKLILVNFQAPGDLVTLTAAVRDLHRSQPGRFLIDVRTSCPELWDSNPYLTPIAPDDPDATVIQCEYPLIHESNRRRVHFLHGFVEHLRAALGVEIELSRLAGDIHLSAAERREPSLVEKITGLDLPFWIIAAGGKFDYTIKWWHFRRWQSVVDQLRGRVLFVQVGEKHHYHPALGGVIDLRGRTPMRELIRLVHHAQGVLCPVTFLMHLSAAVEPRPDAPAMRSCVVVAGGREPVEWEAYPGHEFLHTIGQLPCCAEGGCWRSRSVPLGDGDAKDQPEHLCVDTIANLPRCMSLITPDIVVAAIHRCLLRVVAPPMMAAQWERVARLLSRRLGDASNHEVQEFDSDTNNTVNHQPHQTYA